MNIEQLLYDNGEIEFNYSGNHYFMACYYIKHLFKKNKVEYWLIGHLDDKEELQKFDSFSQMLDTNIDGKKLKDILVDIEIE